MLNKLLIAILCPLIMFGALPDNTVTWEVRTTGNDTNGGAFVTGSTGTDMSQFNNKNATACTSCQSATVNISTTDAVAVGTTTITSATMNGSAAIVGNLVFFSGGTGSITAQWRQVVTFVSNVAGATTFTIDTLIAASVGMTMNVGGALLTPVQMSTNMALSLGAKAYVQGGVYLFADTLNVDAGAPNFGSSVVTGYSTVRGDNGKPIFRADSPMSGTNKFLIGFTGSPENLLLANFNLDGNGLPHVRGIIFNRDNEIGKNLLMTGEADFALSMAALGICEECTSIGVPSAVVAASSDIAWKGNNIDFRCINCAVLDTADNNAVAFSDVCQGTFINTILGNFSGTNTNAWTCTTQESPGLTILNTVIYGFSVDAFRFNEGPANDLRPLLIRNSVISNVTGFCFNSISAQSFPSVMQVVDHNSCKPGMGFYNNWGAGVGDVTLTADPFTNGAGDNFTLNSTSGGGAAVKGQGFPGVVFGGTGHMDMGALQSAGGGGGGGGGSVVIP